jgi:hypothetical protein
MRKGGRRIAAPQGQANRKYSLTYDYLFSIRSASFSKEGTMMITEFHQREKESSACGVKSNSLHSPGSSGSGPWALRPKRLQWLINISTGFKIAAPASGLPPSFLFQNSAEVEGREQAFPSIFIFEGSRMS